MKRIIFKSAILAAILSLTAAQPALAYIDPNTGGMLFQILAVVFASLSAILLFFSRQVRTFFARTMRSLRERFGRQTEASEGITPPESEDRSGPPA